MKFVASLQSEGRCEWVFHWSGLEASRKVCMLPFQSIQSSNSQVPHLQQGTLCFGTRYQKVETISNGKGYHHPHGVYWIVNPTS